MDTDPRMTMHSSTCPAAHTLTKADDQPEAVDLLQMVPDASRSPGSLDHRQCMSTYAKTRSLDSSGQRMHFVLLPHEEQQSDYDADSGVHICNSCRGSDAYHQQPVYSGRPAPPQGPHNEDGSIYFNYLRFANTSSRTSPCTTSSTYEPVTRGRGGTQRSSKLSRLSKYFRKKSPAQAASEPERNKVPKSETRDWRRIKRLLLLAGVLLGILVALGGMVIGFLLLSPKENDGSACSQGFIECEKDRCVRLALLCQGRVDCPGVDEVKRTAACSQLNSSQSDARHYESDSFVIETETPMKGLGGWVHYSKGSVNGSKYTIMNKASTFYGAQEECRKKGAYLAHINSIREQIFIEEMLKQELLNRDISKDGVGFWLGARRARGSHSGSCMYDQWKWVDPHGRQHGVISGFAAFIPGKPDNYFDPEECLYISYQNKESDKYLKWDDAPCDIHSVGGIKILCEAELR